MRQAALALSGLHKHDRWILFGYSGAFFFFFFTRWLFFLKSKKIHWYVKKRTRNPPGSFRLLLQSETTYGRFLEQDLYPGITESYLIWPERQLLPELRVLASNYTETTRTDLWIPSSSTSQLQPWRSLVIRAPYFLRRYLSQIRKQGKKWPFRLTSSHLWKDLRGCLFRHYSGADGRRRWRGGSLEQHDHCTKVKFQTCTLGKGSKSL